MSMSIFLAKLFGLYFIIAGLMALIRYKTLRQVLDGFVENRALMFITSILTTIMGLLLVLNHNLWQSDWRVVITVISWLALIKGLVGVFIPETFIKLVKSFSSKSCYVVWAVIVIIIGLYLAAKGFAIL